MSLVLCLKVDVLLHFLPPPCVCLSHSSAVRSYTGLLCCTFFHTLTLILAPLPLSVSAAVRHTHTLTISSLFFFYFSCISLINNVFCIHESPFPPPFLLIVLISLMHFGLRLPVGSLTAVVHFHSATSLIVICIQLLSRHIPLAVSLTTHTIAVSLRTVVLC